MTICLAAQTGGFIDLRVSENPTKPLPQLSGAGLTYSARLHLPACATTTARLPYAPRHSGTNESPTAHATADRRRPPAHPGPIRHARSVAAPRRCPGLPGP